MLQVLDFLSDRARGFILTMGGAAGGTLPTALIEGSVMTNYVAMEPIQKMQICVLGLTGIVAILTIISYVYKFYKWIRKK